MKVKSNYDSPIKAIILDSIRLDSGRPIMYIDVRGAVTKDGEQVSAMLTSVDIEYLIKYFEFALPLLYKGNVAMGYKDTPQTKEAIYSRERNV
mgnify:FL=1|jgi:hypothetical protein|tara:strand:+ start:2678 stop:2956 length:279 start_codon:yes stop_codon:yes gene_type:complete